MNIKILKKNDVQDATIESNMNENQDSIQYGIQDQIDFKLIDQFHNATLNFSKASIQIKQMMLALAAIMGPILVKLAGDALDMSLFICMYIIIIIFWILDSYTYYYQEKLRIQMNKKFKEINERHHSDNIVYPSGFYTISEEREKKSTLCSIIHAFINWTTLLYFFLCVINTVGLILFCKGIIG